MTDPEGIIATISTVRDKANRYITHELRKRGIDDIGTPYGAIFVNLFRGGELTMGDIARGIRRDKSTVTVLVRKLLDLGYIETSTSPQDARATVVRLTEKGKSLEPVFLEITNGIQKKIYKGFTDTEKEVLATLLERVRDNF
jgi:MarR family transcriptional regulator, organic hydroperoxide resistance regulator